MEIKQGTVNLETMMLETNESVKETIPIKRTPDNIRKRPNGHNRHDPF